MDDIYRCCCWNEMKWKTKQNKQTKKKKRDWIPYIWWMWWEYIWLVHICIIQFFFTECCTYTHMYLCFCFVLFIVFFFFFVDDILIIIIKVELKFDAINKFFFSLIFPCCFHHLFNIKLMMMMMIVIENIEFPCKKQARTEWMFPILCISVCGKLKKNSNWLQFEFIYLCLCLFFSLNSIIIIIIIKGHRHFIDKFISHNRHTWVYCSFSLNWNSFAVVVVIVFNLFLMIQFLVWFVCLFLIT